MTEQKGIELSGVWTVSAQQDTILLVQDGFEFMIELCNYEPGGEVFAKVEDDKWKSIHVSEDEETIADLFNAVAKNLQARKVVTDGEVD